MDIRNPRHPYYSEYQEMKKDVIFKHPRVHDWGGGLDTANVWTFPYKLSFCKEQIITGIISNADMLAERLRAFTDEKQIVVYGLGVVGKILVQQLIEIGIKPAYILDKHKACCEFKSINVFDFGETKALDRNVSVVITPILEMEKIKQDLDSLGYCSGRIHVIDLLGIDFHRIGHHGLGTADQ